MAKVSDNAEHANDAAEIEQLRTRVNELEQEIIEVHAWANLAIATAQAQSYWIDKYHIDLNGIMQSPGGKAFRGGMRGARYFYRFGRRAYLRTRSLAGRT